MDFEVEGFILKLQINVWIDCKRNMAGEIGYNVVIGIQHIINNYVLSELTVNDNP